MHSVKLGAMLLMLPAASDAQLLSPPPPPSPIVNATSTGPLYCAGKPDLVAMNAAGKVHVRVPGVVPEHTICSVQSQDGFVTGIEACKSIYASLLTAWSAQQTVHLFYTGPTACSQIPEWSNQTTFYHLSVH